MRILVFGIGGLIGSTIFRILSKNNEWKVYGTINASNPFATDAYLKDRVLTNVNVLDHQSVGVLGKICPDVVINCVGLTKHHRAGSEVIASVQLNSIWPNQLNVLCKQVGARLIQVSTDCVFSGRVGNYSELDAPDALDIYGRSKILGEIHGDVNAITIRTSTLGHEFKSRNGLLEWFLSQRENCLGFKNAIFSGLPTIILADIIQNHIIPNPLLSGLYHIGAGPIDKFTLLNVISKKYKKDIVINPEFAFSINRSLCIDKFIADTGYKIIGWDEMIDRMYIDYKQNNNV